MNVSILMSVRNGAKFLPSSIKDIESNVFQHDEILIIDDGSSDKTGELLATWARDNSQVRVISTKAAGFANALNLGITEAKNDWIARFDVDDRYPINRLSTQRSLISDEISAIFCDYQFWSEASRPLGVIPSAINASATAISLVSSQRTPHPGVMYNRNSVIEAGSYRNEDFPAEDISLWLRMAKSCMLISVPQILVNYRLSQSSMSGSNRGLGIEKTKRLIREIGIDQKSIENCLEDWQSIFKEYSRESLGVERKLLFHRDLKKSLQYSKKEFRNSHEMNSILFSLAKKRDALPALYNLAQGKILRRKYRNS